MNKQLNRVFWRWFLFGQSGWNYEKMQGLGYLYSIYPFLAQQYRTPPELQEAASVHSQFFNTNSTMAPAILGINIALERQSGLAAKEAVTGIKTGLMGPLAGIGDTLFFVIPTTIIGSVASWLALQGNPAGLLLWLLFALVRMLFMRFSISKGYQEGVTLLGSLTRSLNRISQAANILGLTVIGALIPAVVKAKLSFTFSFGDVSLPLQQIADQIMPGLMPLLVVVLAYWLLGLKRMNATRVILALMVIGIIGYRLNIFA